LGTTENIQIAAGLAERFQCRRDRRFCVPALADHLWISWSIGWRHRVPVDPGGRSIADEVVAVVVVGSDSFTPW